MKLKFKHQDFQATAASAVVDVFKGQPNLVPSYIMDNESSQLNEEINFTGWCNQPLIPEMTSEIILKNIQEIQCNNYIPKSTELERCIVKNKEDGSNVEVSKINLTVEMETGVGKTYTYIKTMYELNKNYGWSKFVIVVPSIAIREGIHKSLQITQDHFAEEYGKKIRFFIYNSSNLTELDTFASSNTMHVMIINAQAFNANGKDARRIHMELDEFRSQKPIDIIAKTNPIVIIDEPQSVEGEKTMLGLAKFNPLMILRYSATHKKYYNMVYRLDAIDAYNQQLVKKITVKGITTVNDLTSGYVYLEEINLSASADPMATINFNTKGVNSVYKIRRKVGFGYNLYEHSKGLQEYNNNFIIKNIDGRDNSVEFVNGIKIYAGDVIGNTSAEQLRRIQIRETIKSHIEREMQLFNEGIKVLSLFFIDEVSNYKQYDKHGVALNGIYADIFEEEYSQMTANLKHTNPTYSEYLDSITAKNTHAGYFSIDKKGRLTNSKVNKEQSSDDIDAYDLIMKDKELLLDIDPNKSPVRFIFSHSALKEGWDNPNVFQICTLKHTTSEIRRRQEVGRGLRLCVNQNGERMDKSVLGEDIHKINVLTVIASESYEAFATSLQHEMAGSIRHRTKKVTKELFEKLNPALSKKIFDTLSQKKYIDKEGTLTDNYYDDRLKQSVKLEKNLEQYKDNIIEILDSTYLSETIKPENSAKNTVSLELDQRKLDMQEFKELWKLINKKSRYIVNFETEELIVKAIKELNEKLNVPKLRFFVETGTADKIKSIEDLANGTAIKKISSKNYSGNTVNQSIKYDLVGKLAERTGLTRNAVVKILKGIEREKFDQFKNNPENFIIESAKLINSQKAAVIVEHIEYDTQSESYSTNIFASASIKGNIDNTLPTIKHLYDYVLYDSNIEKNFASELDISEDVAVYVKLPSSFFITTPVGKYNPDWAIAFYEGSVKHIYFVAETKGSTSELDLRLREQLKTDCAKEHFKAVSNNKVKYGIVDSYKTLLDIIS
ncbi:restriction endonuclease subunit R [Candidatus Epulonipiscium fishelsonii]|uniref:Restriction endonuclease subunit R n=1 Tax=Candidatus Epulonipiscium fishelsonii TaxID=77094 RepID=A0ACC8XDR5_9FIRM|nr:restriction endonuclease subunit R [Epulopiscium sp. SCG-B05WGA-EpuloA1]ONI41051.1 restriction endonuclease subunit R [Epulopiscium sp. SCG-B11WGA-EpuloA1]